MNVHKKIGPFPVWAWGVAIAGGIVLGIYMRRRARASQTTTTDPNAALDALTGPGTGFGIADPNAGLDSSGIISGLMQQNSDLLSYLMASGGGSPPGIPDPATYEPQITPLSTPTVNVASSSTGAAPTAVVTSDTPAPEPPPPDAAYAGSYLTPSGTVDTGAYANGVPLTETKAVAQGADVVSAGVSSTGGVGGTGYLMLSDKTIRPGLGVAVMQ